MQSQLQDLLFSNVKCNGLDCNGTSGMFKEWITWKKIFPGSGLRQGRRRLRQAGQGDELSEKEVQGKVSDEDCFGVGNVVTLGCKSEWMIERPAWRRDGLWCTSDDLHVKPLARRTHVSRSQAASLGSFTLKIDKVSQPNRMTNNSNHIEPLVPWKQGRARKTETKTENHGFSLGHEHLQESTEELHDLAASAMGH